MAAVRKKYSILHIITHLQVGGAQDNTLYTLEKLNRKMFNVSLAANMSGEFYERVTEINDLQLFHLSRLQTRVNLFNDVLSLFFLIKLIKTEKFDIIHTHSTKPGVLGRLAAFICKKPIIIHTIHGFAFHDFMPLIQKKIFITIEKCMNLISDHLIAVSILNIKKMLELNLTKSHLVTNIYSGIDLSKFSVSHKSNTIKNELKLPSDNKLVGFIGRFSEQKDPLCFLMAIQLLTKTHTNIHYLFVGGGPLKPEMIDFISKTGLSDIVTIWDYRDDIDEILDSLDLFVVSSIYEGIGRSLTESMAKGIPVVATEVEGVPEIVIPHKTGRLVPPKNPSLLADGIRTSFDHISESKLLARNGQKWIIKNFDVDQMVRKIEKVYEIQIKKKMLKIH